MHGVFGRLGGKRGRGKVAGHCRHRVQGREKCGSRIMQDWFRTVSRKVGGSRTEKAGIWALRKKRTRIPDLFCHEGRAYRMVLKNRTYLFHTIAVFVFPTRQSA